MNANEKSKLLADLEAQILRGEEYAFQMNGRTYRLYVWEQCDGSILHLTDENGEDIWQSAPMQRKDCAAAFREYVLSAEF